MNDVENALRELYRDRERLVTGDGADLLAPVRERVARRRTRSRVLAASAVAVAVLAGAAVAVGLSRVTGPDAPPVNASQPPGWRLESSLGAQIAVPAGWATNDYGCRQTAAPSVVRGGRFSTPLCDTPEPATKEVAIVDSTVGEEDARQPGHAVTVDGVSATRAQWRRPDGRYAGWVAIPGRKVAVIVRTTSAQTTRRILDSIHLVDPDHLGCPTARPAPTTGAGIPRNPEAIDICSYGGFGSDRLQASTRLTGGAAAALATALDTAAAGGNPDLPASQCGERRPPPADVVLRVHGAGGAVHLVRVTFSSCTGRGIDDGSRRMHVTQSIVAQIMNPLYSGYFDFHLP